MAGNFQNLAKDINLQIQEAAWNPNRINLKKTTLRHITIKFLETKNKDKFLKVVREKQYLTVRGKII